LKQLIYALFLTIISFNTLNANSTILQNIKSYQVKKDFNITSLDDAKLFRDSTKILKVGNNTPLMIKLELFNNLNMDIERVVTFSSALIEELKIYKEDNNKKVLIKDLSFESREQNSLYPYFNIKIKSKSTKIYYIYANSKYISTYFTIKVEDKKSFFKQNSQNIFIFSLILGALTLLFIVLFTIYLFNNKSSYLYLSLFVLVEFLIFFYFSGIEGIFVTKKFLLLDKTLIAIKFNLAVIVFAMFAIYYFKLHKNSELYKAYIYIIYAATIEIIASGFINIYYFIIPLLLILPIINISTGVTYIKRRYSILFILANVLFLVDIYIYLSNTYLDIYIDNRYHLILFILANFLLSIMLLVRYYITQKKEEQILGNMLDKKLILDNKIKTLKSELKELENSKIYFKKSMNDIIKNNLKMVLSMLKIQHKPYSFDVADEVLKLSKKLTIYIEIYSLFLSIKETKNIDLKEYLPQIIDSIKTQYQDFDKNLNIKSTINTTVSLNEALDITLTVANIIISSYEDISSLEDDNIEIVVDRVDGKYNLAIKDLNNNKANILNKIKGIFN